MTLQRAMGSGAAGHGLPGFADSATVLQVRISQSGLALGSIDHDFCRRSVDLHLRAHLLNF